MPRWLLVLGVVSAAVGVVSPVQAEQFRFSRASMQCLMDNAGMVRGVQEQVIFLDVSVCPPAAGGSQPSTEQRSVSKLPITDSSLNSILIVERGKLDCYLGIITGALQAQQDPLAIDFAPCG